MKRGMCWIVMLVFSVSSAVVAQSLEQIYQEGLHQEEVVGDLAVAIESYEQVVGEHATNQPVAAQAQLRIALCYQKLGNYGQAQAAFRRVIEEFGEPLDVVAVAQQHLERMTTAEDYFPLAVGNQWVFSSLAEGDQRIVANRGTSSFPEGMAMLHIVEHEDGSPWFTTEGNIAWHLTASSVDYGVQEGELLVQVHLDDQAYTFPLLKPPFEPGTSWEFRPPDEDQPSVARILSHKEVVSVPAGEFKDVLVVTWSIPDDEEARMYFAKGVGWIKIVHRELSSPPVEHTVELVDYKLVSSQPQAEHFSAHESALKTAEDAYRTVLEVYEGLSEQAGSSLDQSEIESGELVDAWQSYRQLQLDSLAQAQDALKKQLEQMQKSSSQLDDLRHNALSEQREEFVRQLDVLERESLEDIRKGLEESQRHLEEQLKMFRDKMTVEDSLQFQEIRDRLKKVQEAVACAEDVPSSQTLRLEVFEPTEEAPLRMKLDGNIVEKAELGSLFKAKKVVNQLVIVAHPKVAYKHLIEIAGLAATAGISNIGLNNQHGPESGY